MVVCDVHEVRSGIPSRLTALGASVEIRALPRGDYIVRVDGLVERKTVADLHRTILQGRFWAQIGKIRVSRRPYLLIEGRSIYAGPVPDESIRAMCLSAADLGVTIIRSRDPSDTAAWLLAITMGSAPARDRPTFAQRPRSNAASPAVAALAAAPGVSIETARTVLHSFTTLAAVAQATEDDLRRIPGVGANKTKAIFALFHQEQRSTRSS